MPTQHTAGKAPIIGLRWARPARWAVGLLAVSLLAACSALQLAYRQAPNLTYWWLNGQFSFNDAQSVLVRQDVDSFFAWHRKQALPELSNQLRRWQGLARSDWNTDQVCREVDWVRARLLQAFDQSAPAMARMSLQLQPGQLDRLKRKQTERNQEVRDDFVDGDTQARLDRRLERTAKRMRQFYGSLTTEQEALLRSWLARSPWDAQRSLSERMRLQQDIRDTIRLVQTTHGSRQPGDTAAAPVAVQISLRSVLDRAVNPSNPTTKAYNDAFMQHSCAQLAAVHNSMSPAQRTELARTLGNYADELGSFTRPD
jgi:hypothetical protein